MVAIIKWIIYDKFSTWKNHNKANFNWKKETVGSVGWAWTSAACPHQQNPNTHNMDHAQIRLLGHPISRLNFRIMTYAMTWCAIASIVNMTQPTSHNTTKRKIPKCMMRLHTYKGVVICTILCSTIAFVMYWFVQSLNSSVS